MQNARNQTSRPAPISTVAGISGDARNSSVTRVSNGVNDVGPGVRSYFGGESDPRMAYNVVRDTASRFAIAAFEKPYAAGLRTSA